MKFLAGRELKNRVSAACLAIIMMLWGLNMGYPLNLLQNSRWTFLGHAVPIYFFFTAGLMLLAATLSLALKRDWSRWELFWWALPLICVPALLHSDDPVWSARQWMSWIIRGVIPGGVIFITTRGQRPNGMLMYWIYPIVIVASLLGLIEVFTNRNPIWDRFDYDVGGSRHVFAEHNPLWDQPKAGVRGGIADTAQPTNPFYRPQAGLGSNMAPRGTQANRIPYASTLVGFLPMGLWFLKHTKRRFYAAQAFSVGTLASILLLAQVRSAWLGTLVAILALFSFGFFRNRREAIKLVAAMFLCLGIFAVLPNTQGPLWSRFNSFHLAQPTIRERMEILKATAIWKDHWLLGIGFGQFPSIGRSYYPDIPIWRGTPDDQYLRWAIENGIPGFICIICFLIGLTHAGWNEIQRMTDVRDADYYKSLLAGWLGICVTFFFFDGFYWGACNMTFWALLGLFATCLKPQESAAQ